jgi:hypothetical protein
VSNGLGQVATWIYPVVAFAVLPICGPLLYSDFRPVAVFGIVNLVAVVVLATLTRDGFASRWCG